jgi:RNA methyltransferase, TrmH family
MISKSEIKRLNALKIKKYRGIHRQFVVEGPKVLNDFLSTGMMPDLVFYTQRLEHESDSFKKVGARLISEDELLKISSLQHPQGCIAVFNMPDTQPPDFDNQWLMAVDNIQDPGNLGTLIRTADWFGLRDFICSEDTVDCYNPKVVQASMGSLARVQVHYMSLEQWLSEVKIPVYAGLLEGEDIRAAAFDQKGMLLIGNEGKGVRDCLLPFITHRVMIPRLGRAESLNAAVAGGIMASFALLSR